jgi:hypothetical protein
MRMFGSDASLAISTSRHHRRRRDVRPRAFFALCVDPPHDVDGGLAASPARIVGLVRFYAQSPGAPPQFSLWYA